ncbi:MAG: hypothetical protein RLZ09_2521 [Pseudomonadota bacterium]
MSTAAVVSLDRSVEGYTDRSSEFISSPLPEWIWSDVERLYQSVFSSRVMLEKPELIGSLLYAWVERNEQQITDILLFRELQTKLSLFLVVLLNDFLVLFF